MISKWPVVGSDLPCRRPNVLGLAGTVGLFRDRADNHPRDKEPFYVRLVESGSDVRRQDDLIL